MQLLDAALAMVLTLAALATIVTVIMEVLLRSAHMRKRNLVEVMKLLNQEMIKDDSLLKNLSAEDRWTFVSNTILNPSIADAGKIKRELDDSIPSTSPELDIVKQRLKKLGYVCSPGQSWILRVLLFIRQTGEFFRHLLARDNRAFIYDKVSMEHLLRRLGEIEAVKQLATDNRNKIKQEFNRIARKYEEYGSAVSANFKRHAQKWSIVIGIIFAFVANVDGLRIFEAYRADTELALGIISQQDAIESSIKSEQERKESYEKARQSRKELEQEVAKLEQLKQESGDQLDADNQKALEEAQDKLQEARALEETFTSLETIRDTAQRAQQQVANLVSLGVPMGWDLYPRCPYGSSAEVWRSSGKKCQALWQTIISDQPQVTTSDNRATAASANTGVNEDDNTTISLKDNILQTLEHDTSGFLHWAFAVLVTGALIGLGAPFWFDIAKRLAQIRQGLRESASAEVRMSGNNADGKPEKRKAIVEEVIADMLGEDLPNSMPVSD